jgi:hypothetical protein
MELIKEAKYNSVYRRKPSFNRGIVQAFDKQVEACKHLLDVAKENKKLTEVFCTRVISSCIVTSASVLCCLSIEYSESNLMYYRDNCIVRKQEEHNQEIMHNKNAPYFEKYRPKLCHWGSLHKSPNRITSREKTSNSSLQKHPVIFFLNNTKMTEHELC